MTELQSRCAGVLLLHPHSGADDIAFRLGYRPAMSGRLAVTSALRALERSGVVYRTPPRDRWDHARWGLRKAK